MKPSTVCALLIGSVMIVIGSSAFSDPPPDATAAPGSPAEVETHSPVQDANKAPVKPSADLMKKARLSGMHTEMKNGTTMFCKEDADLGTRFVTKKCLTENQLVEYLNQQQANRDTLHQGACANPTSCGSAGR